MRFGVLFFLFIKLMSISAQAQIVQSKCSTSPTGKGEISGVAIDKRLPIASVSKLVTSYWALRKAGPHFQYHTKIKFKKVTAQTYDVHIEGSQDPYFGREKLHFLVSELNQRGIQQVRRLTFDENFLFLQDLDIFENPFNNNGNRWVWFNWYLYPASHVRTKRELQKGFLNHYSKTLAKAQKQNILMVKKPKFSVAEIEYLPLASTQDISGSAFYIRSAKLISLLKEMNRNSNNFSAVSIFNFLGGPAEFRSFIKKDLDLGPESILFYEGSGNRVANEPKYNEASCRALLKVFQALDKSVQQSGFKIQDVVSVIGQDGLVNEGTGYSDDNTHSSGVAKTGTVDASISLGGMLNTHPIKTYFMFNVKPKYPGETRASRALVAKEVRALARQQAPHLKELDYRSTSFLSFDQSITLHPVISRLK
jgi:D-alanyl-D-alanine carboxypeptidase/D-alanyl-D-alanine-endopeptidase (penicillin-binding protein 4)